MYSLGTHTRIKELEAFSLPSAILSLVKDSEANLIVMGHGFKTWVWRS